MNKPKNVGHSAGRSKKGMGVTLLATALILVVGARQGLSELNEINDTHYLLESIDQLLPSDYHQEALGAHSERMKRYSDGKDVYIFKQYCTERIVEKIKERGAICLWIGDEAIALIKDAGIREAASSAFPMYIRYANEDEYSISVNWRAASYRPGDVASGISQTLTNFSRFFDEEDLRQEEWNPSEKGKQS
jgi:hypothetical protein|tara:strand:- start:1460 stop:2032 length:573 start_codon:yes stop_codon:yes gene_type:complete